MIQRITQIVRRPYHAGGVAFFILFICVCVVTQMLGMPVTLLGAFDSDRLMQSEPTSEDPSILTSTPQPERPGFLRLFIESCAGLRLPVLPTSVFRPPLY